MNTAPGSNPIIIALTLLELNRSSSDGTTPSGSVGSEYDSDIAVSYSCWLNCDAAITTQRSVDLPRRDEALVEQPAP
jgi:hypothetical protein